MGSDHDLGSCRVQLPGRPASCNLQPTGTSKPSSCNNLTCNLQPAPPAPASASEREREGECESARLPATETQAGSTNPTGRYELRACPLVLPSLSLIMLACFMPRRA